MAGHLQQDSFMDDSDDCCPLCVEEFDLSDRSFRPCPCGYQVCQFCYNNIKTNMNGLCPACRRPYDDKNIQWKVISPEEAKADVAAQARKKAAARQKEAERRQAESQNRKHLAGLRVLQKNLVYVVGMNIPGAEDHVLETLRGPNHFGQYGPIIKILVSKTKEGQPLGIYVTFANKEDAATCISVLDGVPHEGRNLRAQYGTTKYCSAFLRNETCNNRNCMFLHETGEPSDSFSRQDLSSFNALSTQRSVGSKGDALHPPKHQPPVQQSVQAAAASTLPASSNIAKADAMSRSDSGDSSALPTSANWAKNPHLEHSKKSGQTTSHSTPSPKAAQVKAIASRPQSRVTNRGSTGSKDAAAMKSGDAGDKAAPTTTTAATPTPSAPKAPKPPVAPAIQRLEDAIKYLSTASFAWKLDRDLYDEATLNMIDNCPPLIDPHGGAIRYAAKRRRERERERAAKAEERKETSNIDVDDDENLAGGSLQLGGEPDADDSIGEGLSHVGSNRRPLGLLFDTSQPFPTQLDTDFPNAVGRSLTPQQQRNIQLLKSSGNNPQTALEQFQRPSGSTSQHQPQLSNPFQSQNQQLNNLARHGRQSSRYTFTSDAVNPSTAIKPMASTQILQQTGQSKGFGNQSASQSGLYTNNYSNIQGPPPGLKSSGTPPISGGGMFGQGHGFTSGIGGNMGNFVGSQFGPKNTNEEMMRDMLRSRGSTGATGSDLGKLDLSDPSILQARMHHASTGQSYSANAQDQAQNFVPENVLLKRSEQVEHEQADASSRTSRKSTPVVPPGIPLTDFPPLSSATDLSDRGHTNTEQVSKKPLPSVPRQLDLVASGADAVLRESNTTRQEVPAGAAPLVKGETNIESKQAKGDRGSRTKEGKEKSKSTKEPVKGANKDTAKETSKAAPKEPVKDLVKEAPKRASESSKREKVSKLDIFSTQERPAKPVSQAHDIEPPKPGNISKEHPAATSVSGSLPPSAATPVQAAASPVIRQPRTLRLIQSSDAEVGNNSATVSTTVTRSRQPSSERGSGTPARETPSDAVSVASNSISRTTSPHGEKPATKIKGKVQTKKETQPKAKPAEGTQAALIEAKSADDVVQAPIIGRKKKTKKAKTTAIARNDESNPPSPAAVDTPATEAAGDEFKEAPISEPGEPSTPIQETDETESKTNTPVLPSASVTIENLQNSGEVDSRFTDFFSTPPSFTHRPELGSKPYAAPTRPFNVILTQDEITTLEGRNEPIIVKVSATEAAVVLPNHTVLRYLSHQEAASYLRSWKSIALDDPAFLSSTLLPSVYTIDAAWKHCLSTPLSSTGYAMTPQLGHGNIAEQLALSTLGGGYETSTHPTPAEVYYRRGFDPTALAAQMENMSLEDAEHALRTSEQMMGRARMAMELEEKKLVQMAKRNRKALNA